MRVLRLSAFVMLAALASGPVLAQAAAPAGKGGPPREMSPEVKADSDAQRALAKATPALPMERVLIKITGAPFPIADISAMTQDKQGNIYLFHRPEDKANTDAVVVADATGKFLRSWGKGLFTMPHGIRVDPDGNVWTVDANKSIVVKFSAEGKKLLQIDVGDVPDPSRAFCGATDVTFAKDGHVFLADGYCNARYIEYDAAGKKLRQWGSKGKGNGEFVIPHDLSLNADNSVLYVADRENGRLQWFDREGKYLGQKHFGGQLFSTVVAPDGMVYVGTRARGPNGTNVDADSVIFKFDPKSGQVVGQLNAFAHQISVGADGTVLPGAVTVRVGGYPKDSILVFRAKK